MQCSCEPKHCLTEQEAATRLTDYGHNKLAEDKPDGFLIIFARQFQSPLIYLLAGADITRGWTVSLTLLAVFQWFNAWNCRSDTRSIFLINPFSNKFLIAATGTVIALQIFAVYHPLMNRLLHTAPFGLVEWTIIIPIAASVIAVEEIRKFFRRRSLVAQ